MPDYGRMDGTDPASPGPVHDVHLVHVVHSVHSPLGLEKMMQPPGDSGNLNTECLVAVSSFDKTDSTMEVLR